MEFMNVVTNEKNRLKTVDPKLVDDFLILLSPFAPHIAEELWERCGHKESIFKSEWPTYDPKKIESQTMTLVIQINGKLRANLEIDKNISVEKIKELARSHPNIQKQLGGKTIVKEIYVPQKLINFVVKK
jgi:leucyl-tRNA synthetase